MEVILAAAMAFSLSACVVGKKPQTVSAAPMAPKPVSPPTPESPPGPLSMPQTVQELPPAQPLSNEAIASTESPEETPTIPAPRNTKPARSGQNRIAASRTAEPVGPPTPAVPPVQPPAESEPRPQIQEIVPAAELKRLQGEADKTKQEIRQRLQQIGRRHLSPKDQETKNGALSYLRESDEAEKLGDMRKAFELASRGLLLVKLLTDGR